MRIRNKFLIGMFFLLFSTFSVYSIAEENEDIDTSKQIEKAETPEILNMRLRCFSPEIINFYFKKNGFISIITSYDLKNVGTPKYDQKMEGWQNIERKEIIITIEIGETKETLKKCIVSHMGELYFSGGYS